MTEYSNFQTLPVPMKPMGEVTFRPEVFGPVPVEVWQQACEAPALVAERLLRRYDALWGIAENGAIARFKIKVSKKVTVEHTAYIEVDAVNAENAEDILDAMDWDDFKWREGYNSEDDDHQIESVSMIEPPR